MENVSEGYRKWVSLIPSVVYVSRISTMSLLFSPSSLRRPLTYTLPAHPLYPHIRTPAHPITKGDSPTPRYNHRVTILSTSDWAGPTAADAGGAVEEEEGGNGGNGDGEDVEGNSQEGVVGGGHGDGAVMVVTGGFTSDHDGDLGRAVGDCFALQLNWR